MNISRSSCLNRIESVDQGDHLTVLTTSQSNQSWHSVVFLESLDLVNVATDPARQNVRFRRHER